MRFALSFAFRTALWFAVVALKTAVKLSADAGGFFNSSLSMSVSFSRLTYASWSSKSSSPHFSVRVAGDALSLWEPRRKSRE